MSKGAERQRGTCRWIAAVAIAAALAVIAALPAMLASRVTERDLTEALSGWTGSMVTWRGEPKVTVFPRLEITITNVTVLDRRDGSPAFASIPELNVSFKTLPLLWGSIETAALSLVEPRIRVASDPTLAAAWQDQASGLGALVSGSAGSHATVVTVSDGEISYRNDHTGAVETIQAVDLRLSWDPDARVAAVAGRLVSHGRGMDVDLRLHEPWNLFSASGSRVRSRLAFAPDRILWVEGEFRLDRTRLDSHVTSLLISEASFRMEGITARGGLRVARTAGRPRVTGKLEFEELQVGAYLDWLPDTLAELLALGLNGRWLQLADLDLELAARHLDVGGAHVEEPLLRLSVDGGELEAALERAQLAGGEAFARLEVKPIALGLSARMTGRVDGVSLAEAGANVRRGRATTLIGAEQSPRGLGAATFDFVARGATVAAMVASLQGSAEVEVRDGSIDGADTVTTLERLVEGDSVIAEGEAPFIPMAGRTHFSRLTARLAAGEGVATLERVHLTGEQFEIGLSAELDLIGGEVHAEGSARLLDDERGGVLIELPFGIGGTLMEPMAAPGIPRRYPHVPSLQQAGVPPGAAGRAALPPARRHVG